MTVRLAISLSLTALGAAALPLAAQEQRADTARAAPIVVTATRLPLSRGSLPVAVTVITGDELRLRGVTTVAAALSDVTSAYVAQSGSQGATTSLFLRGGESKYVKVLVDGVPANEPGGMYDFASLTTDNVDRIEVVRGPVSVIYGADAVTGVVNVITRRGSGRSPVELDIRGGTAPRDRIDANQPRPAPVATSDLNATMAGDAGAADYSLSVARHQTTGLYQINNQYRNNVFSGRVNLAPIAGADVRLALRYTDYSFNYPTSGGGTPDSVGALDVNARRTEERTVAGVEVERALHASLRTVLALSSSVNDGGTDDQLDQPGGNSYVSHDRTRRRGAELRLIFVPAPVAAITLGAQLERQDQRSRAEGQFGSFPFTSEFSASRRNRGGYAEGVLTPTRDVTLTLGGRLDDNEQFGTFRTGRVGASWRPFAATRFRATAGSAFREPTFNENYSTGYVTGNPGLLPEHARSADVGVEQEFHHGLAQLGVTAFWQRFRNMIDYSGSASACGFSYCNVAAARSNGVEVEGQARLAPSLRLALGTTVLRTRVLSPGFDQSTGGLYRAGESLIRRPEHTWNAQLSYHGRRLSGAARLLAVGRRTDRDFRPFPAVPVTLDAYRRVDIGGEYALHVTTAIRSALTLHVENLTNAGYQSVFNFLAPRRSVMMGIKWGRGNGDRGN